MKKRSISKTDSWMIYLGLAFIAVLMGIISLGYRDVCNADKPCLSLGLILPLCAFGALVLFAALVVMVNGMSGQDAWRGLRSTRWSRSITILGAISLVGLLFGAAMLIAAGAKADDLWMLVGPAIGTAVSALVVATAWFLVWRFPTVLEGRAVVVNGRIFYSGEVVKLQSWRNNRIVVFQEQVPVQITGSEDGVRWQFNANVLLDLEKARARDIRAVLRVPQAVAYEVGEEEIGKRWFGHTTPIREAIKNLPAREFCAGDLPMIWTGRGELTVSEEVIRV